MRDYNCLNVPGKEGVPVPVAQLPTAFIIDCLRDADFEILANDGHADPVKSVTKRLILELEIRAMGLRA